jgi:hypothetical protein
VKKEDGVFGMINVNHKEQPLTRVSKTDKLSDIMFVYQQYLDNIDQDYYVENHDLSYFFELVQELVDKKQKFEGIEESKRFKVVEDSPMETIDTETITFLLTKRLPGRFDRGSADSHSKIKEVVPHLRSERENTEFPGEIIQTFGAYYDNWITFNIFARTSKVALKRILWFESLMSSFKEIFSVNGFQVIQDKVNKKEVIQLETLKVMKYSMSYFVRHQKLYNVSSQTIKDIVFMVGINQ